MECPSAERLASNEMTSEERGAWLDHAASCSQCRAVALVMSDGEESGGRTTARHQIGRFVISHEIGRGAMGIVYAADDPELGRRIAIKVLHDANAVERLRREARALARLDHPNVVRIYDVGIDGDRAFVAMELIPGVNMRRWLASGPRTRREIIHVLVQAGRGLAAAHAAGIVHRDFKPDNVFVASDRVVVGDFGLSRFGGDPSPSSSLESSLDVPSDGNLTASHAVVGTPAYMAPEQAIGEATAASDQFAFCVAAWEALLGARPFAGTTLREIRDEAAAHRVLRPVTASIPRRLELVLRRGLRANAEERFPSMDALLAALLPDRRRRHAIVAGVAIAALATTGWWWTQRDRSAPCAHVGEAIFDGWDAEARARVRAAAGDASVAELDRYAIAWRDARTALCRTPITADPTDLERRAAREACYERARIEFVRTIRDPAADSLTRGRAIPLAACESGVVLSQAPGTASDPRGCGCPYSACVTGRRCIGECSARAYRLAGPIPGVAIADRQEAVSGATADGGLLLYLSGKRCALDHLYLARRVDGRYESTDLTPELAAHGLRAREGCCTLARDGSAIIVERTTGPGFVRFPLDGTKLGRPDTETFASIVVDAPAGTRLSMPVLAGDQHFYFVRSDPTTNHGLQTASRADARAPFGRASEVRGRAANYEYATGVSDDGLTMFMADEFATRALVRETQAQPYGDLGPTIPPAHLPGWRTIPIDGCRRLIATVTPGGCEAEESVFLEAVGP